MTIRSSKAFELVEIAASQAQVTKTFELVEIAASQEQVTKSFLLVEIGNSLIYSTKAFVLVELQDTNANVTKAFRLVELGLYSPRVVPTMGHFTCIFGGVDVTSYVVGASLQVVSDSLGTDTFENGGMTYVSGLPDWKSELKGFWVPALDDVFGEAVSSEQNKVSFSFTIGKDLSSVTYSWTNEAFVSNYRLEPDPDGALVYTATISLSGPPSRASRS